MSAGVSAGIGVLVLVLLAADVFLTVFQPQGRSGPLTQLQNRLLWGASRYLARTGSRTELLALAGPSMVVAALVTWLLLLVVGFALIYYPWITSFLISPGELRTTWAEAVYFSGYTAATLGLGDLVPDHMVLRLLTALQAFGGFALVSVSVTYLLSVYRQVLAMQTLAANVAGFVRANALGEKTAAELAASDPIARWTEQIRHELLQALQAHFHYPILHFFRPANPDRALPVQLAPLLRLRALARGETAPDHTGALAQHPSFRALADAVEQYLGDVDKHFLPSGLRPSVRQEPQDETERAYARLLRYMRYPGEP